MSILIKNGFVATMEDDKVIEDGAVYIEDDKIIEVGKTDVLSKKYRAEHVIDAKWKLMLPGFVDSHNHTDGDTLLRGGFFDSELQGYMTMHKWPSLRAMSSEDFYVGALMGYAMAIRTGTTLVADNYYGPKGVNTDGVAKAAEEIGIRSVLCRGYHDYAHGIPEDFVETVDHAKKEYSRLFTTWDNRGGGRIRVWISPVNLPYNTAESILELNELAKKHKAGMHSHVSENKWGVEAVRTRFGKDYMEVFNDLGVLSELFSAAHAVLVSTKEMQLLAETGATAVHNPASNMIFSFGTAPVVQMLKSGVNVALGTDSHLDMVAAMKLAACLQKAVTMDPTSISAKDVVRMATINGARAFGIAEKVGTLRSGKKADVTLVNLKTPYSIPVKEPLSTFVYFLNGSDVDTVIIDGKIIMEEKTLKTVEIGKLMDRAQDAAMRIEGKKHEYVGSI